MRAVVRVALTAAFCAVQSGCDSDAHARDTAGSAALTKAASYSGTDSRGVPRYVNRRFTDEELTILRRAFGVVNPSHLYVSDSTEDGVLKYDPEIKRCSFCYVNSFRLGYVSVRNLGESWDDLELRVKRMRRSAFPAGSLVSSRSIDLLDPDIQPEVRQMIAAAQRAGFQLHVGSTYRSPQQEAMLMAEGGGRTHTLTSLHSYGRAIDITVGDGNLGHQRTRATWIAFRRWVTHYRDNDFRVLGTPDRTWDWSHVEMPSNRIGFSNLERALAAGRACLSEGARARCEFRPHLPSAK
jgi:D-alanyl-D-alanine dipeptidase